eukprot:TRINITY_DN2645_c0_g1_i11.p1 TRINITY_DN2645_c0_g1~~TRINITY_DN2645_c0_g1_i11.p1  ORF type:complete len:216 (+),score=54.66 TRINITY_DN2645_c0_g1_i11:52-699(+)
MMSVVFAAFAMAAPLVTVETFTESFCPCSGTFHSEYLNHIVPAVGNISVLNRSWDGRNDNGTVKCFHGHYECEANTLQACAQHLAGDNYVTWLNYTVCINGPCKHVGCDHQYTVGLPESFEREEGCATAVGLNWDDLNSCFKSDLGKQLLIKDADYDKKVHEEYGLEGLPIVKVNGKMFSKFWDCDSFESSYHSNLIKAICDAYTGDDKPAACSA